MYSRSGTFRFLFVVWGILRRIAIWRARSRPGRVGATIPAAREPSRFPAWARESERRVEMDRRATAARAAALSHRPPGYARAWAELPREIVFLDIETTGLGYADRIVSIGAVRLQTEPVDARTLHLIFNPQRRCHPRAAATHGFDNATLKRQDPFARYAPALSAYLERADRIVSHNAKFDMRFINAEFLALGLSPVLTSTICTMLTYRARGEGPASLDAIAERLGLQRGAMHSAVEDAWLTMQVYLWMHDCPWRLDFSRVDSDIANFVPAPPKRPRGRPRKAPAAMPAE